MDEQSSDLIHVLSMATGHAAGEAAGRPAAAEEETDGGLRLTARAKGTIYRGGDRQSAPGIEVTELEYDIRFLGGDQTARSRKARLILPQSTSGPVPVVISAHYEMIREDFSFYDYLERGWGMLTPIEIPMDDLRDIITNDLRFSLALVAAARRMPAIDPMRIALRGASAGGYHVLLLSAVCLGICCSYDMSGICNMAYEFGRYIPEGNRVNLAAEPSLTPEQRADFNQFPIPFVKTVADTFLPTAAALGAQEPEGALWRLYSPSAHTALLSQPILFSHSTADAIVPVNQVTERYAPDVRQGDLPDGYRIRLGDLVEDSQLRHPLDELLPEAETAVFLLQPPEPGQFNTLLFDPGKRYHINLIDEGAPCKACSHFKSMMSGLVRESDFFEHYFSKTASGTNRLGGEKRALLMRRYQGESAFLMPENKLKQTFEGTVFGSLESDRLDVLLELAAFAGISFAENGNRTRPQSGALDEALALVAAFSGQAVTVDDFLALIARYAAACGAQRICRAAQARAEKNTAAVKAATEEE